MSMVYVKDDYGFVGWAGQNIRLDSGAEFDTDDQIVKDMPERFTAKAPAVEKETPPRKGLRRG